MEPEEDGGATTLIGRLTFRKALRSSVLCGYGFGLYIASTALGYAATYKTQSQRDRLAATFGSNAGVSALVGPARQVQTVAGFTVWKSFAALTVVGAVWGLLAATRLLRGEEDVGRWELLLAGPTTRARAAGLALAGLAADLLIFWALTAVIIIVAGRSSKVRISLGPALYLALCLVAGAAIFLAVGALASQLAPTRRRAAGYAATALGASYALRMIADAGAGLGWLRWATPLGWVEELRPLTGPQPLAIVPITALVLVVCTVTVRLAGRRDLGASTIPDRPAATAHTRLLFGPTGLAVRLTRWTFTSWVAAAGLFALMLGFVAKAGGASLAGSSTVQHVVDRLGARGTGARSYLGIAFLMLAILVALIAAGQVSAARAEEAEGRLEHLLVRPVSRWRWMDGRLAVATVMLVLAGLASGLFAWLGATAQDSGVSLPSLLAAGLNLVAPAVVVLGAGALALGLRPRLASGVAYAVLLWSLAVEFIGSVITTNHWALDTSVFHQMAPAPAVHPAWSTEAVLVGAGVVLAALGTLAFWHRDLVGE
jgi:ABC-2 type transport system permease protein